MQHGFLSESSLLQSKAPPSLVPRCGACGLFKGCRSPKMPFDGKGKRKILIVGEAPGSEEDREGKPLVGPTGKMLESYLAEFGVEMRRDCWLTNSAICHPPGNRYPDKTVDYCRPTVIRTIEKLQPEVIILLGGKAIQSVIGWLWGGEIGPVSRWVGWQIPSQQLNAWVCPTWHPAYLLREKNEKTRGVTELLLKEHLEAACSLKGRPWREVPDYRSCIQIEMNPEQVAKLIRTISRDDVREWAFDFETDRLKPDHPASQIVCCAISDGLITLAYPWHGTAIEATRLFLESNIPKIGYNLKFEDRWCRKIFSCGVNNWVWDGMLAAHTLDNRPGITSLKFQAFVRLGVPAYNEHIRPFLEAKGVNEVNRIREVDLQDLLTYNALDALLEWKVAEHQRKEMSDE